MGGGPGRSLRDGGGVGHSLRVREQLDSEHPLSQRKGEIRSGAMGACDGHAFKGRKGEGAESPGSLEVRSSEKDNLRERGVSPPISTKNLTKRNNSLKRHDAERCSAGPVNRLTEKRQRKKR